MRIWIWLIVAGLGALANGAEMPSAEAGRILVEAHCAACHAIGPEGTSPLDLAPPFRELHLRYDVEALSEALVEGIVTAHEAMPEFAFEPVEAASIISYLKTLEPGGVGAGQP